MFFRDKTVFFNQWKSESGAGGGGCSEPLNGGFRGLSPLRHFLGCKEHLGLLKIDLYVVKIIAIQDYKCTEN